MGFLDEREAWERGYWTRLLNRCKGNITRAARESGFCRQNVYKVLNRLQISITVPPGRRGNAAWRSLKG